MLHTLHYCFIMFREKNILYRSSSQFKMPLKVSCLIYSFIHVCLNTCSMLRYFVLYCQEILVIVIGYICISRQVSTVLIVLTVCIYCLVERRFKNLKLTKVNIKSVYQGIITCIVNTVIWFLPCHHLQGSCVYVNVIVLPWF